MYICLYLDIYCLYLQVSLFISASITVSICMYSCQYLHDDSARIPVCICMFPCLYLQVSLFISACILPSIWMCISARSCMYPVCIWTYTCSYLFVPCFCLHFQFNAHSANHRPSRPAKLQHTQTHTQPLTHPHSLCSVFLTPVHKCRCLVSAASATASVGVTARSCLLLHRFEKCCVLAKCEASHLPPSPSDWSWESLSSLWWKTEVS